MGLLLELNQLFILVLVRPSISGSRRKKSVRADWDIGMGSETPMIAPSRLRPRKCEVNLDVGDFVLESELCRPLPRQITPRRARSAPASMPGKKPAATAAPGKRSQCAVIGSVESMPVPLFATAVAELFELAVAEVEVVLDVVEDVEGDDELSKEGLRELVALTMLQTGGWCVRSQV